MSMEIYVFSDSQLPSVDAWQSAIDIDGFSLQLSADRSFAPAKLNDRQTAFECGHWDLADLVETHVDTDFGHRWKYTLSFRWGSNVYDGIAAYMAGSVYAKATGGVVFDCEEGKIISPERAGEIAFEIERQIPMIEEAMRRVREKLSK